MYHEGATGRRQGSVLVVLKAIWWCLLGSIVACMTRPVLAQETPLFLSNLINCFYWVIVVLGKELLLVLDPFHAWWVPYAVWSRPCPVSYSCCLIPHCPALLLSDPVVLIINCFLFHSVYDKLFSICIAWSWHFCIISCCLILMLANPAAAP